MAIKSMKHSFLTKEQYDHIINEGFEEAVIDFTYAYSENSDDIARTSWKGFKYSRYEENYTYVYIFKDGIDVDIDASYGGNLQTAHFSFKDNTFEEAYEKMIDFIN